MYIYIYIYLYIYDAVWLPPRCGSQGQRPPLNMVWSPPRCGSGWALRAHLAGEFRRNPEPRGMGTAPRLGGRGALTLDLLQDHTPVRGGGVLTRNPESYTLNPKSQIHMISYHLARQRPVHGTF